MVHTYAFNQNNNCMDTLVSELSKMLVTDCRSKRLPVVLMNLNEEVHLFQAIKSEFSSKGISGLQKKDIDTLEYINGIERLVSKFGYEYAACTRTYDEVMNAINVFLSNSEIWDDIPEMYWIYFSEVKMKVELVRNEITWDSIDAISIDIFYAKMKRLRLVLDSISSTMLAMKDKQSLSYVKDEKAEKFVKDTRKLYAIIKKFATIKFDSLTALSICCDKYIKESKTDV